MAGAFLVCRERGQESQTPPPRTRQAEFAGPQCGKAGHSCRECEGRYGQLRDSCGLGLKWALRPMDMDRPAATNRGSAAAMKPVALITGASSGIGAALAHIFAQNGHEVVLAARRVPQLVTIAQSIRAAGHRA